jgi:hypothetical protein
MQHNQWALALKRPPVQERACDNAAVLRNAQHEVGRSRVHPDGADEVEATLDLVHHVLGVAMAGGQQ